MLIASANCRLFDSADGRIPDYHQYRIPHFTRHTSHIVHEIYEQYQYISEVSAYHKNQPNVGKYTMHGSYGLYIPLEKNVAGNNLSRAVDPSRIHLSQWHGSGPCGSLESLRDLGARHTVTWRLLGPWFIFREFFFVNFGDCHDFQNIWNYMKWSWIIPGIFLLGQNGTPFTPQSPKRKNEASMCARMRRKCGACIHNAPDKVMVGT